MHYRASLMAMVGAGTLLLVTWITGRLGGLNWKVIFLKLSGIGGVTLLFFLPWTLHVILTRSTGYSLAVTTYDPVYFSLKRIGIFALNYPTNLGLLIAAGIAFVWGLLRKDWRMIWLVVWVGMCLILSMPRFAGVFMDFVSVIISMYVPLAVGTGWLAAEIVKPRRQVPVWIKYVFILFLAGLTVSSMPLFMRNVRSGTAYVQPGDLEAIEWIRNNTPESAYFMVNLYHFPFSPDLVISLDAGYWLPLLGGRRTVSLPMSYMSEKFRTAEGINTLKELDALGGKLCKPEAETLLTREGVTHVFIGSVGGPISVKDLLNCPDFSLEFQHESSYVFRFAPRSGKGPN